MISDAALEIYARFKGDIDGFSRTATDDDRAAITDAQWREIDSLIQELHLLKNNRSSKAYSDQIAARLVKITASEKISNRLTEMALQLAR